MLRITPPARHEHSIFESRRLEHVNPIGPLRLGAGKVHPISFAAEPKPRDIASTPRSLRRRSPHLRSIQLGEDWRSFTPRLSRAPAAYLHSSIRGPGPLREADEESRNQPADTCEH
jgi:hypothetical protein